ncbi:hypothetical protein AOLI_G00101970 [Acnodon oligacanthus]
MAKPAVNRKADTAAVRIPMLSVVQDRPIAVQQGSAVMHRMTRAIGCIRSLELRSSSRRPMVLLVNTVRMGASAMLEQCVA